MLNKHLFFFYGDVFKLKSSIAYQLSRYKLVENKTQKVTERINKYKAILNEISQMQMHTPETQ